MKVHPMDENVLIDFPENSTKYYFDDRIPEFILDCIIHDSKYFSNTLLKFIGIEWFPKVFILEDYTFRKTLFVKALSRQITKPKDVYNLELDKLEIPKNNIPIKPLIKFLKEDNFEKYKNKTSSYQEIPYYLNLCFNPLEFFKKVNLNKMKKEKVVDCFTMANRLGHKVNINWTYRRFKEQHDIWVSELNDIKYKDKKPELLENKINYGIINIGDIVLITNEWELFCEGSFMRHCVAGYWNYIENKTSIIGKYKDNYKNTVEIKIAEDGNLSLGQMKKRYNHRPTDKDKQYVVSLIKGYRFDYLNGKIYKKEKILI